MFEPFRDHWLAAYPSAKLGGKPVGATLLGHPIVLFRPSPRTTPVAFPDRCPHRNAPLSAGFVRNGCLVCPYHGWTFDSSGACQRIPSLCNAVPEGLGITPYLVMERDGIVWVRLTGTTPPPPYRPDYLTDPKAHLSCSVMDIAMPGTLLNVIENFLDATHTHFVHADLIRTDSRRAKSRVAITLSNDRVEAAYTDEAPQTGLISRLFEGTRQSSSGRFILPGVAEIEIRSPQGTEFAMTAYVTPVTDTSQRAQVILALPSRGIIPGRLRHAILGPFLQAAIAQDRKILDLQQRNIARFGEERFHSTEVDLLRPYIRSLLQNGPAAAPSHREVILEL